MRSVILWEPTLLRGSRWTSGRTRNSAEINIEWVRLPPCQWPIVGLSAATWLIKKVWINFKFWFVFLIAVFDKQANIHCSINSISRPISSHDHNSTDQPIAMDRWYQNGFRKLDNFYSLLIYDFIYNFFLSKDFQSSYITFVIFNNSTVFDTTKNKWKVTINFDNT